MTLHDQQPNDLLIFAIDPAMRDVTPAFLDRSSNGSLAEPQAIRLVTNAGEALRLVFQHEPGALMVWVSRSDLPASTALIDALRRRRPELPLLAVTPVSDAEVERAVRIAGAAYYFALDGNADPPLLRQTLEVLGLSRSRASPAALPPPGLSQAASRSSRIRGRPPAVYRSP